MLRIKLFCVCDNDAVAAAADDGDDDDDNDDWLMIDDAYSAVVAAADDDDDWLMIDDAYSAVVVPAAAADDDDWLMIDNAYFAAAAAADDDDGETTLMLLTVERLGSCYVKVEDVKRHHCPLYKTLTSPPSVRASRPFGVCVFAPSSDENQTMCSHRQLETRSSCCWMLLVVDLYRPTDLTRVTVVD